MISRLTRVTFFIATCFIWESFAQDGQLAVIAHPSVVADQIEVRQLRMIFTMRQTTWPGEGFIHVFVMDGQNEFHQAFCKYYLNMFPYQVERLWNKLVYSGLGEKPSVVNSVEEMLLKVSQTPGAIGYLPPDNIPADPVVKSLTVVER